jgi:hypothetical protein
VAHEPFFEDLFKITTCTMQVHLVGKNQYGIHQNVAKGDGTTTMFQHVVMALAEF